MTEPQDPEQPAEAATWSSPSGEGDAWPTYEPGAQQPAAFPAELRFQQGGYVISRPHKGASISMGLGIGSVVCAGLALLCGVTLPGVLMGPFAIVLAVRAQREIGRNPGAYSNAGAATTGLVTGIIGTGVGVLVVVLVLLLLGFAFSFGG